MIINRHNYEEYFLLYVDNELDEIQRAAVETFVQHNPDVAKELEMLKQSTLLAEDDVKFNSKDILYKTEEGISLANYEEYFLLAVDKELNNEEVAEVEKFVLQHSQLQDEFTLLQLTILPREIVEFGNKSILYRQEKTRRVIPIPFMRMGVAASVIGIIATLWMLTQNDIAPGINIDFTALHPGVKATPQQNVEIKKPDAVTQQAIAPLHTEDKKDEILVKSNVVKSKGVKHNNNVSRTSAGMKSVEANTQNENDPIVAETIKPATEKLPAMESSTAKNTNNSSNANAVDRAIPKATFTPREVENSNPIAKQAVYNEIENVEESNSIYIGAAELNKAKVKALLRKAVSFFDKKNNKDDSEKTIQIASFQIKSK